MKRIGRMRRHKVGCPGMKLQSSRLRFFSVLPPFPQLRDHRHQPLQRLLLFKEKDYETASLVELKMQEIFNSNDKNMFDELLDSISNAFEYWRYIYEKNSGSININFLRFFRLLLREICCEQLYDKTWAEFIE